MSMKIYNGFKLTTNNIFELHTLINDFREELKPLVKQKITQFFANSAVHVIDHNTIHPTGDKCSPYQMAFNNFSEQQEKVIRTKVNDPAVDFSFSLCIIPFEESFYGVFYTSQREFGTLWKNKAYVQDYHYQNQSDPSEEVSDEDWAERERIWETIFDKQPIPSLNGFVYDIVLEDTFDYPNVQEVISIFPSFEERVTNEAKNEMYSKFMNKKNVTPNNVVKMVKEWKTFFDSDEGQRIFSENKIRMTNTLKKSISHEMVIGK